MYICIWVPVDYPPNPLPRVQVTELCPVCSVSRDSCLCLVQGLLWWWRGVLCGYLGAGGLFFADPYIVSCLYVVSCRLFCWADLTKLHIFKSLNLLHWINHAKTLPQVIFCKIFLQDPSWLFPNLEDNSGSHPVLGTFWVLFITFSNFGCKIATFTVQAKSTQKWYF